MTILVSAYLRSAYCNFSKYLSWTLMFSFFPFINILADFLNNILSNESSLDSLDSAEKCFPKADDNYISADEGGEATQNKADRHNVIASPSTNKSSCIPPSLSAFSILSGSSGVDIRAETTQEHMKGEHNIQLKPRKKPKKKSRSLLGVESLSFLFKAPSSPNPCRRAQSMGYCRDLQKSKYREVEPVAPLKQMCIYRRPILSCDEGILEDTSTLVKVVIFGGNREVGRLARAYCNLQKKKNQYTRLTQTCKLQFYFVPTKRSIGNPAEGNTLTGGQTESSAKPLPSEVRASKDGNVSHSVLTISAIIYYSKWMFMYYLYICIYFVKKILLSECNILVYFLSHLHGLYKWNNSRRLLDEKTLVAFATWINNTNFDVFLNYLLLMSEHEKYENLFNQAFNYSYTVNNFVVFPNFKTKKWL